MSSIDTILSGAAGAVEFRYKLYLSNINGDALTELRNIVWSGSVSMSNFRDHSWELSLDMKASDQVDPLRDYLLVKAQIRNGNNWQEFPLGLYRMKAPSADHLEHLSNWSLTGQSLEVLVAEDMAAYGYTATTTAGVLAQVRTILQNHGVPAARIALPQTDKMLTSAIRFDPASDAESCKYLRIINALLNAGGFRSLQTDATGRFISESQRDTALRAADVTYTNDGMITGSIKDDYDDARFANRVVALAKNVNDTPLTSIAENRSAASAGSIETLGRIITKVVQLQGTTTQADLDRVARSELIKSSGYYRKLSISTLPDPRRGPYEIYEISLTDSRGGSIVEGLWSVVNWTLPLTSPPAAMTHELSGVEVI